MRTIRSAIALAALAVAAPGVAASEKTDEDWSAYIDPDLRSELPKLEAASANVPRVEVKDIPGMRRLVKGKEEPRLADVPVIEKMIPGANGAPDIRLVIINAGARGDARPGILHTHGGGFILGSARSNTADLQRMAKELGCVLVSVDYRLAPEATYKDSIEDNYSGLLWMYRNAGELGVDPKRIALFGESAGGGHAALLAITARDRGEVPVLFQALVYPMLDDRTGSTVTLPPHIGRYGWTSYFNRLGWEAFLGQAPGNADVPVAAVPARNPNLSGLPPTFIQVGGSDLFVSEDLEYARRLNEAGVATELQMVPQAYHGFDVMVRDADISKRFAAERIAALRRAFERAQPTPKTASTGDN